MRWPSVHWTRAQNFVTASPEQQETINAIFQRLNIYLGNYIGEFLGELTMNTWFLTTSLALLSEKVDIKYVGYLASVTAILGYIGGFSNVTSAVAIVSEVNNYLLPLFLVILGIILLREKPLKG